MACLQFTLKHIIHICVNVCTCAICILTLTFCIHLKVDSLLDLINLQEFILFELVAVIVSQKLTNSLLVIIILHTQQYCSYLKFMQRIQLKSCIDISIL